MLATQQDPRMIGRETIPILARLLVRQGRHDASHWLDVAADHADRTGVLEWLVPTGLAWLEHGWLTSQSDVAARYATTLLKRTDRTGMSVQRGEMLRYLRRLGHAVEPPSDCPDAYAAGIRGDWRGAARLWQESGDPYERALELAESTNPEPLTEALEVFNDLGAQPAAAMVRRQLRDLGVARIPRRRSPGRHDNLAGLTDRQLEILRMVAAGMSNAEIAERLIISSRTVDHHVSAVLHRLGASRRQEAAELLSAWQAQT
jgi:DNA-binding CsgD family transcriptional regulator